jgi:mannose-1-phosphate guanylyltransferase
MKVEGVGAVMVLCAGLGTRLRPLTEWRAKPMVPVGDAPAVDHVLARVAHVPIRVVNVHHRPGDLERWAAGSDVSVSHEVDLLGTAGGVAHARALLGEGDVLVWNGDILSELDAPALIAAHAGAGAAATLAVRPRAASTTGQGNVGLSADGRVVRLRDARFGDELRSADFLGVHVVSRALREELPAKGCLVGDVYIPALARGVPIAAHVVDAPFVDIGTISDYVAANHAWLARRREHAWAAPDASVNAAIDGSIVGARTRIDAPALRCIVWPDAHVRSPVFDAIVTPYGNVAYDALR